MSENVKYRIDGEQSMIYWRLTAELKDRWAKMLAEKVQRCRNGVSPALLLLPDIILSSLPKKKMAAFPCQFVQGVTSADRCIRFSETDGSALHSCAEVTSIFTCGSMWRWSQSHQCFTKSSGHLWWINQHFLPWIQFILCLCSLAAGQLSCCRTSEQPAVGINFPGCFFWSKIPLIEDSIGNVFIKSWPAVASVSNGGCAVHNFSDFVHMYLSSLTNVKKMSYSKIQRTFIISFWNLHKSCGISQRNCKWVYKMDGKIR